MSTVSPGHTRRQANSEAGTSVCPSELPMHSSPPRLFPASSLPEPPCLGGVGRQESPGKSLLTQRCELVLNSDMKTLLICSLPAKKLTLCPDLSDCFLHGIPRGHPQPRREHFFWKSLASNYFLPCPDHRFNQNKKDWLALRQVT